MTMTSRTLGQMVGLPLLVLVTLAAGVALCGATGASAATPSGATISEQQDATWSGGPFAVSAPGSIVGLVEPSLVCAAGTADPTCDHFALTVDGRGGTPVVVAIAGEVEGDDYDLVVFYPDGTVAASGLTPGEETVVFEHRTDRGTGPYDVRVQAAEVSRGSSYRGSAMVTGDPIDRQPDTVRSPCFGSGVPSAVGVAGVTDGGQTVALDVLVLLNGITRERGEAVMTEAAEAYAPLSIALSSTFRQVSFTGFAQEDLIRQAKTLLGGARPEGIDVVYVLSPASASSIRGLTDCIGGVRFPERAFAAGEDFERETMTGPFVQRTTAAQVAAHEIGHLLGAEHQYANCTQGISLGDLAAKELSPCTLMFPRSGLVSLVFSTPNAVIVRGHAVNHAAP